MDFIKMTDLNLVGKRILIRSDLNVPVKDRKIISDIRIRLSIPTIEFALKQGACVIVASHLGRPKEGMYNDEFSLKPIVDYMRNNFFKSIYLSKNYLNDINTNSGKLIILENVRFNKGENSNDANLAKKYAKLCDIFVMDAFGVAHRIQASTYGVGQFAPLACAGPLFISELKELNKALDNPTKPMVAIIGGSKISTKLKTLNSLAKIADYLIIGGGIANTFIAAQDYNIGKSLYEADLISEAKRIMKFKNIILPVDVRVAPYLSEKAKVIQKSVREIQNEEHIFDLGDNSIEKAIKVIKKAKTILWNGPVGAFEFTNFSKGTKMLANAIADSKAFSIAGGGDTLSAINMFGISDQISYISTGGGAFLKFVEDKKLPAILMLEKNKVININ